jgi:GTP-binding protein
MKQTKIEFVKSAVLPKDFPAPSIPEVAICGRSNAGKSSFINGLSNQKLAKVS